MNLLVSAVDTKGQIETFPNSLPLTQERRSLAATIEIVGDRTDCSQDFRKSLLAKGNLQTLGNISDFCKEVNELSQSQYLIFQSLLLDGYHDLDESINFARVMVGFDGLSSLSNFLIEKMPKALKFYDELVKDDCECIRFALLVERFPLLVCNGVHGTYADVDTILAELN